MQLPRDSESDATSDRANRSPARVIVWIVAAACGVGLGFGSLPAAAQPLPDVISPPVISVELVDVAQVPPSSLVPPLARLNLLLPSPDDSGRLFVNDMRGFVWILRGQSVDPTPFLDVNEFLGEFLATDTLQTGLSTFAFHPDYAKPGADGEGRFYTVTSESISFFPPDFNNAFGMTSHYDVLSEWRVDASNPDVIDTSSRRVLMRIAQPHPDHNMGQIAFDPNAKPGDPDYGILYVAAGDGGGYNANQGGEIDPFRVAQDPSNPFGSIMRIDPLGTSTKTSPTNGQYGIPTDNPFVGNESGILEEIWAYGFRNPHRYSWDIGGLHTMIISDIGQVGTEEIDLGVPGGNFGWSEREGYYVLDHFDQTHRILRPKDDASFGYIYPAAQYSHLDGAAVVGGFVYRGSRVPQLRGQYVFGDIANGRVFHVPVSELLKVDVLTATVPPAVVHELQLLSNGVPTTMIQQVAHQRVDLRFGTDADGEIYLLSKRDGMVRTLVPEPGTGASRLLGLLALGSIRVGAWRRRRKRR